VDRIGARRHRRNQRVTGLVVRLFFFSSSEESSTALDAHHHFVFDISKSTS